MLFFLTLLILLYINAKLNFSFLTREDNIDVCRRKLYIAFEDNYPGLDDDNQKELAFKLYLAVFFVFVFGFPIIGHFVLKRYVQG